MVDTAARAHYKPPARWPLDISLGPQHAQVAQLVEHATENRSVGGSIPPLGTTNRLSWLKKSPLLAAGHFLLDRRCNPIATARQKNALSALFSDGSAFR